MMEEIRKTISFKLKTDIATEKDFDNYFLEFAKAVNFYLKKMHQARNYYFINIPKNEQKESICEVCNNKNRIIKQNISDYTFSYIVGNKTLQKIKSNSELKFESGKKYFIKPKQKICSYCYGFVCGDNFIRKQFYPNRKKNWLIKNEYNIENAANLSGTDFGMAFEQAKAILKSRKEQQKSWKKQKYYLERRLQKLEEIKYDKDIDVDDEDGKKITVKARITVPPKSKRHKEKYKHYMDNEKFSGKTMNSIDKSIEGLQKTIKILEERNSSFPYFKGNVIQLHNNSLRFYMNNKVTITLGTRKYPLEFLGTNVKHKKSKEWFKRAIENILSHKITYAHIVKKDNEFFLEYPIRIETNVPIPNESYKALGIDRGVKNIIVMSTINHKNGKPYNIKFFSGDELWKSRVKYRSIIKSLTGVRRKNREMRIFGGKVKNISKNIVQNISREVIDIANQNKPIVIVMENLKNLKEQKRVKRYSKKTEKRINYKISSFIYGQIQKAIEYKSKEAGIPVIFVEAENTSRMCSMPECKNIDPNNRINQSNFKCTKCGFQINADINASINIANSFYDSFKNSKI